MNTQTETRGARSLQRPGSAVFRGLIITDLEIANSTKYCDVLRAQLEGRAKGTVSKPAIKAALHRAETRLAELRACLYPPNTD